MAWRPLYGTDFFDGMTRRVLASFGQSPDSRLRDKAERLVLGLMSDQWCDVLVEQMRRAGIARAVLLVLPGCDDPEWVHAHHHAVVRRHPDRLLAFASVDPRTGDRGLDLFRRAVRDLGFRGAKLYPPMGYRVDDPALDGYFATCSESSLPALIHVGPSLPELNSSFGDPRHLGPVVRRWPRVNFVLAHAGFRLDDDSVSLARSCPNVYLDLAGFRSTYNQLDRETIDAFGRIFDDGLHQKVLFGTDWPLFSLLSDPGRDVAFVTSLFRETRHGGEDHRLDDILYGNAARVLGMTDSRIDNRTMTDDRGIQGLDSIGHRSCSSQ